jgi:hypothetical protein
VDMVNIGASQSLHRCDNRLTYAAFLVISRGDRKEAARTTIDTDKAVLNLLGIKKGGKISNSDRNLIWIPAVDTLGLRSWLWFVIAAVAGSVDLVAVPRGMSHNWLVWALVALAPALPSALFVSRQVVHVIARRSLRSGTIPASNIRWIRYWHADAAVVALLIATWGIWIMALAS